MRGGDDRRPGRGDDATAVVWRRTGETATKTARLACSSEEMRRYGEKKVASVLLVSLSSSPDVDLIVSSI